MSLAGGASGLAAALCMAAKGGSNSIHTSPLLLQSILCCVAQTNLYLLHAQEQLASAPFTDFPSSALGTWCMHAPCMR